MLPRAVLVAALLMGAFPAPARAEEHVGLAQQVELIPEEGGRLRWGDGFFGGTLRVSYHDDGLAVVEVVDPETYLLGIQEVPYSWHPEALRAQVVAARTYLAWTLANGRSRSGRQYGYDICATDACQVYRGIALAGSDYGEPWVAAVTDTAGEVLFYEGRPAQALYSSTTGGRSRSAQDVFTAEAVPYLQAVPSPGEDSPFTRWTVVIPERDMEPLLWEAGLAEGELWKVEVETTADGSGPWVAVISSQGGSRRVSTWQLRGMINRAAAELFPDRYPTDRPDGRRYPQTVLSPSFVVEQTRRFRDIDLAEYWELETVYRIEGHGWGHMVGMSQYGAKAMAETGSLYSAILAHYYGGLLPVAATDLLPDQVAVGLGTELTEATIEPEGPVTVMVDGEVVATGQLGGWQLRAAGGAIEVRPPEGLGLPPRLRDPLVTTSPRFGRAALLGATLTAPAEVRFLARVDLTEVVVRDWHVEEAGRIVMAWDGRKAPAGTVTLVVEARSPHGFDRVAIRLGPE